MTKHSKHPRFERLFALLTSRQTLFVFAVLQALALTLTALHYHARLNGLTDGHGNVVTGDFPAFYTAGRMIASKQGKNLYDLNAQKETQERLLGRTSAEWQPYPYPPLLALAMAPLSTLGSLVSYRVFCALMLISFSLGFLIFANATPALAEDRIGWSTTFLLILGFTPLFRTIIGGQNTPLTLGLMLASFGYLAAGRQLAAGACLGLLSYKPQILPLLVISLLASRLHRATWSLLAVCAAHYLLGAICISPLWPLEMMQMISAYQPLELQSSLMTHISAIALLRQIAGEQLAWLLALPLWAVLLTLTIRSSRACTNAAHALAVALLCALLASPHLQYYDISLVIPALVINLNGVLARLKIIPTSDKLLLMFAYFSYPAYVLAIPLTLQPLAIILLALGQWVFYSRGREPHTNMLKTAPVQNGSES